LGVFQRYRRNGAGAALLSRALEHLDPSRPVQVVTFHQDYEAGKPALRLYRRSGFRVLDDEHLYHGLPRTLMQRDPPTDSGR
jgi:ribosomal protein S18 acetylase RimI-like enzyme